ncbi:hypothetical protein [Methylobacterium sp. Leaf87]|uniref:hypothetical protein n=1 Tax=Methylobacterium sp. Leaf87 TaxID=1736243 RepID=UPI0012E7B250|nr:hypothetical protein [Methylobacterium sp. Leaf87]
MCRFERTTLRSPNSTHLGEKRLFRRAKIRAITTLGYKIGTLGMNFDGAENAKAEVFLKAFRYAEAINAFAAPESGPTFAPLPGTEAHEQIQRARRERAFHPKEKIGVGILRYGPADRDGSNLKVGLFLQHQKLRHHPVVETAQRIAKDEIEIIVTGRTRRQATPSVKPCRPLLMGESVGHLRITAGTIGCFGIDRDGSIGILSNNHVLAATNAGRTDDIILQPGRLDGGHAWDRDHRVAKLKTFIPITFDPVSANLVDCAFAALDTGRDCEARRVGHTVPGAEVWDLGAIEELVLQRMPVRKVGRTTRYTEGVVEAVEVDNVQVQMVSGPRPKFAMFNKQIAISGVKGAFSKGGDSGSLICTKDGRPVALLFAGTETGGPKGGGITYGNPIRTVLDALDLDIYIPDAGA